MNASPSNVQLGRPSRELLARSLLRKTLRRAALWCCAGTLMLLALLLTGCASKSTLPSAPVPSPLMPAIATPLPSVDYSISVRQDIENWATKLKGMFQTSEL